MPTVWYPTHIIKVIKKIKSTLAFEKVFVYNTPQLERWQSGNAADC